MAVSSGTATTIGGGGGESSNTFIAFSTTFPRDFFTLPLLFAALLGLPSLRGMISTGLTSFGFSGCRDLLDLLEFFLLLTLEGFMGSAMVT